jgi:hypothetical protein
MMNCNYERWKSLGETLNAVGEYNISGCKINKFEKKVINSTVFFQVRKY